MKKARQKKSIKDWIVDNKNILYLAAIVLLCHAFYLILYHLFVGDLMFHTDIARDFLLIDEMITTRDPALIGPKAGGLPGMFFGPIWLYLNSPMFLLSGGNPIAIGYFWVLLLLLGVGTVYWVSLKIFSKEIAILSSILYAFLIVFLAPGFTQSIGPAIISPLLLYFMYRLFTVNKLRYLYLSIITVGIIFQFQPAPGMLFGFLTLVLSLAYLIKVKKIIYIFSWILILLPLSTYVLFEIRHDFLQVRAFLSFLFLGKNNEKISYVDMFMNRLDGFLSRLTIISGTTIWEILFVILNIVIILYVYKRVKSAHRIFYLLFYSYYFGFWLLTFLFKGTIWDYYTWGFIPLISILYASTYSFVQNKVKYMVGFSVVLLILALRATIGTYAWVDTFVGKDNASWKLNKQVAEYIYQDAEQDFGYYVYSPDEFGYPIRYAIKYLQQFNDQQANLCSKYPITYIINYPNTIENNYTTSRYFKEERVNIKLEPIKTRKFSNMTVEKYILTEEQIAVPSDSTIVCNLHFR